MLVAGFCVGSTSGMAVKEIEINFVHDWTFFFLFPPSLYSIAYFFGEGSLSAIADIDTFVCRRNLRQSNLADDDDCKQRSERGIL